MPSSQDPSPDTSTTATRPGDRRDRADGGTRSDGGEPNGVRRISSRAKRSDGGHPTHSDRTLVLHPDSGNGNHAHDVRRLATEHGFSIRETEAAGDAIRFARDAVESGAEFVAAAGGDGTLNEVIEGIRRADGFERVTFGVVPCGTGNNFATNVGIEGIEHAFELFESGERRRIDLGIVEWGGDEPPWATESKEPSEARGEVVESGETGKDSGTRAFLNSCVGGFTAEASDKTSSDLKERLGVVAYVVNTLHVMTEFDGIRMHIDTHGRTEPWSGDAVSVLVGNGRRFPVEGRTQADMEDGQLDVTVVEERPTVDLVGQAAASRLFGRDTEHIDRFKTPAMHLDVLSGEALRFSLDGEMIETAALTIETLEDVVELPVGDAYEPDPDD
ncbi:diacylglycerol/lipid kinase family protein [Haloprofundus halobius]|uniref:diacylglycerol/lipid kinase family protein n=1 Tax=Haloprofundus halobius TaxID=2876194 RepID=UPI001CCB7687|nr:YegS/Rv2252/BmrU family lipid kinase [Haloprofundus halobius]